MRERPTVESVSPSSNKATQMRGIISPCTGCKNNIPVNDGDPTDAEHVIGPVCPKRRLYHLRNNAPEYDLQYSIDFNFDRPLLDEDLRSINPVWPALKKYNNGYAYVFVATYEDNVENGWNPSFDTEKIHCRGPYLIKGAEIDWHKLGHLEQGDPVFIDEKKFFIQGQSFMGFVDPGQIWQVAQGYVREIDRNIMKSNSANGSI